MHNYVIWCAIKSMLYFAAVTMEQPKAWHASRTTIILKLYRIRDYIVAENCCSDGKCTGPFLRCDLGGRSQTSLQQLAHGHLPPFWYHCALRKWKNMVVQISMQLLQ